ncbi:hypothetical protein AB0M02_34845 [Actinoplanes sp. NPDC051861]|uniref:hypothetical protein n=1 Tax=Actinoplanes sp. NPDC051861 TaxID=3155170 RepID=UPI003441943F
MDSASLTMAASAACSARLIEESVPRWAAAADQVDAFEVALALSATAGRADDGPETLLARSRLLLLAGRPGDALVLLARQGLVELPVDSTVSWPNMLLAACRAANGDPGAYRWLLSAVAASPGGWEPLYLVGAAAEQRGDYRTADQAWITLVRAHRITTGFTLARYFGAIVARRDRHDPAAAAQTLIDVVEEFVGGDPDLPEHPQPILAAAGYLRQRADNAGAALLLHAASRRLPGSRVLTAAAQDAVSPAGMRRWRRIQWLRTWGHVPLLVPAAAVAVWCDIPPLVLAGLVPVLVVHRLAPAPIRGFSAADGAAWRAGSRLRQGPAARLLPADQRFVGAVLIAIALTATVPIASALAGEVTGRAAAIARTVTHAAVSGIVFAVLTAALTTIGFGLMALARGHNWRSRQHARSQADRYRLADAGDCRCWRTVALAGSYAAAYRDHHLTAADSASRIDDRIPDATLARCPTTGMLWLATRTNTDTELLLLRGVAQPSTDQPTPAPATGGYL